MLFDLKMQNSNERPFVRSDILETANPEGQSWNLHAAGLDESDDEIDETANSGPVLPEITGDPYTDLDADAVAARMWDEYPNFNETWPESKADLHAIREEFSLDENCCDECGKAKRAVDRGRFLRCVGSCRGYRCQRWAHRVCAGQQIHVCRQDGCSTVDPDKAIDLAFLYFHSLGFDVLKTKSSATKGDYGMLAKGISSLICRIQNSRG